MFHTKCVPKNSSKSKYVLDSIKHLVKKWSYSICFEYTMYMVGIPSLSIKAFAVCIFVPTLVLAVAQTQ